MNTRVSPYEVHILGMSAVYPLLFRWIPGLERTGVQVVRGRVPLGIVERELCVYTKEPF